MLDNIFNVSAILEKIERNKEEKNLYQKVNQLLKGAACENADLILEVEEILEKDSKEMKKNLRKKREELEASKA